MSWSVALGVLSLALPIAPTQTPPVPTLPPVTVTTTSVPGTTEVTVAPAPPAPVTVPSTDALLDSPSVTPLVGPEPVPTPAPTSTPVASQTNPTPAAGPSPASGPNDPRIGAPSGRPAAGQRPHRPRPLLRQPTTRLLAAAGNAADDFAPTGAVAALMGLFLLANGVIRRRDELAHVQLDDRDAIVRFD